MLSVGRHGIFSLSNALPSRDKRTLVKKHVNSNGLMLIGHSTGCIHLKPRCSLAEGEFQTITKWLKRQRDELKLQVIRASVPRIDLDDVFEQKIEIAKAVADELEKAMSHYGYEIVQTLTVDIEPDEHVQRAMNEINAAARLKVAANDKAEAEKIIQIKKAEGEAESKYLSGLGIARQRQAIGLRDSVLGFSDNVPGTNAKDVMDMILGTQYFDTMKDIGAASKSSAVFIPHGSGAVCDIATQIRDGTSSSIII